MKKKAMTLREAQKFQLKHDLKYHKKIMNSDEQLQLEHCTLHLVKVTGHLSNYCEKLQHGEGAGKDELVERVTDAFIFILKIGNLWNFDLEKMYRARIAVVEARKIQ